MLYLNSDEQEWLDAYQLEIKERFPGIVNQFIIFGSKARGDCHADSDLDIILVLNTSDRVVQKAVRYAGYDLALGKDVVPSLVIYDVHQWRHLKENESVFREVIDQEGVLVT